MKPFDLLDELDRYRASPEAGDDPGDLARIRTFASTYPDAFARSLAIGHMTASAWIVDRDGSAAVLLHHRKLDRWLQPGGHADGDADLRRVALREAREETGLTSLAFASDAIFDLDVHAIPARGSEAAHRHYDVRFLLVADRAEAPSANHESHAVRWIALADLESLAVDDSVRRLARKTSAALAGAGPRPSTASHP